MRVVATDDPTAIVDVFHRCFGRPTTSVEDMLHLRSIQPELVCLLAVDDEGEAIGAGLTGRARFLAEEGVSFLSVAVLPAARRCGVASELASWLLEAARGHGSREVVVRVDSADPGSVEFSEALGLVEVDRIRESALDLRNVALVGDATRDRDDLSFASLAERPEHRAAAMAAVPGVPRRCAIAHPMGAGDVRGVARTRAHASWHRTRVDHARPRSRTADRVGVFTAPAAGTPFTSESTR